MKYSTFNQTPNDQLQEPMFLGQPVNVSRYDQQKHPIFEKLIEKQLSFFWRPEEIDISRDRRDFMELPDHEKHIFLSNLKYQTLLDSIQGRSPNIALLPLASIPELETWVEVWSFSETIHSRSYTHIIRGIVNDPSAIFDDIVVNQEILKRASDIAKYYDDLIEASQKVNILGSTPEAMTDLRKKLYLCLVSVYALEAIRFYVSFACSFCFGERELMEGNAKIIKLIARDEALHMSATQHMLNLISSGSDGDRELWELSYELQEEGIKIFESVVHQEKEWAKYLFKDGSMIGLNQEILSQYVEYIANTRMQAIGYPILFPNQTTNPISWINAWLSSDNVQVAPQEVEISSYLVGQIDSDLSDNDFENMEI